MSINAEFRARRERCGATQAELARRAGVTVQTVKLWERGVHPLPEYGLRALEGFEADLDEWARFSRRLPEGALGGGGAARAVRIPFFRSQDDLGFYLSTLADTPGLRLLLRGAGEDAPGEGWGEVSASRANVLLAASADAFAERGVPVERYYVDEMRGSSALRDALPLLAEKADPRDDPGFFDPDLV